MLRSCVFCFAIVFGPGAIAAPCLFTDETIAETVGLPEFDYSFDLDEGLFRFDSRHTVIGSCGEGSPGYRIVGEMDRDTGIGTARVEDAADPSVAHDYAVTLAAGDVVETGVIDGLLQIWNPANHRLNFVAADGGLGDFTMTSFEVPAWGEGTPYGDYGLYSREGDDGPLNRITGFNYMLVEPLQADAPLAVNPVPGALPLAAGAFGLLGAVAARRRA